MAQAAHIITKPAAPAQFQSPRLSATAIVIPDARTARALRAIWAEYGMDGEALR